MSIGIILTLIFLVLKLINVISWEWVIIFIPLMVELVIDIIFIVIRAVLNKV